MSGYVRIHRALLGHPAFRNESETMAFAWLIARAAWKPARVRYKGHSINLKRGQVAISQRDMAAAFDRDKAWIERLWKRLKSEAMIETQVEAGVAVITICNYTQFQATGDDDEAVGEAPREAGNEAAARQRRGTEQRREEVKKEDQAPRASAREPRLPADVCAVLEAGSYTSPPPDLGLLRQWYDAGATLEQDIVPVILREAASLRSRTGQGPRYLKVFDAAIREKLADVERQIAHLRRVAARNADPPAAAAN